MAELHRLLDVFLRARDVRRAAEEHGESNQAADEQQNAGKTDLGKGVGASVENLRHRRLGGGLAGGIRYEASRPALYQVVKKRTSSPHAGGNPRATARFYAQTP